MATATTATATATAAATDAPGRRYVVAPGDTLATLAARLGTTVVALTAANGLADPDLILVGQTLLIPDR